MNTMGCNSSKENRNIDDDGYLLAREEGGRTSHKDMMKSDPTVTKAAAELQRQSQPPPEQKMSVPQNPSNGQKPPQNAPFNRAKDRVIAIKQSKKIETKDISLRYAFFSQRGFYPDDPFKPNQDSFCVHEAVSQIKSNKGKVKMDSLFGVFDGHGKDGHHCAQFTRHHLPLQTKMAMDKMRAKSQSNELNREQIHNALLRAHVETNKMLHRNPQIDDSLSGTTAISVFFHGRRNRITIANVGDSRAVIGSLPPNSMSGGNHDVLPEAPRSSIKARPLSRDQTPYRKDERVRIRKTGARILSLDQLEGLEPINEESENGEELELGEELDEGGDPPRVWAPNGDYPGTAFTRSIGDAMAEELGVFAEPEMLSRELKPEDKILVLASDGVFEFLTNQSVIDICAKFNDPLEACRAVVAEAYELWLQYELRTDDITIIVIFIDSLRADGANRRHSFGNASFNSSKQDFGVDPGAMQKELEAQMAAEDDDDEDEESDEEAIEEINISNEGFKPVRKKVSKEKSKEIAKLKAMAANKGPEDNFDLKKLATPKTEAEKKSIEEAIKASVMFRNINNEQRELVYSCMESVKVSKGEWVIRQGSHGDKFYIIDEGQFEVRILPDGMEDDGQGGNIIHMYEGSRKNRIHPSFGELALMYSAPRSASIIAKSDGHLWALHRAAFRQVLVEAQDDRKDLKKILVNIPYFQYMDSDLINKIAALMDEVTFGRGENIVEQGFPGQHMYVMRSGSCYTMSMGGKTERGTLKAKSFFGEEIFSGDGRYKKTVVSLQTTTCWHLDKAVIEKTMGPLLEEAKKSSRK